MNTKNKESEQPDDWLDDFEDFEDLDEIRDGASDLLHALHVAELAASVLELAKQTPVTNKRRLELVRQVVLNVAPLIEDYDAYVSGDISVNFVEYLDFKLTDDGTDATGWTKGVRRAGRKSTPRANPPSEAEASRICTCPVTIRLRVDPCHEQNICHILSVNR